MIPIRKIDSLIAFLGFVLFVGSLKATLTTFDPNIGGATSDGNIKLQLTSGFIYASIMALMLFKIERVMLFISKNIILLLFLLIPIFSVAWSVSPDATIRRAIALTGSSFFAIYIAFAIPPERVIRILTAVYVLTAIASLFVIFVLPTYGTHQFGEYAGLWRGVFSSKNELGATMAMAIILLLICPSDGNRERILQRFLIAFCLFLLFMSESRAAWVSLLAVGLIALPLRRMGGRGTKTVIQASVFAVIVVLSLGVATKYAEPLLELMGKDPTLTGRTGVWEVAIQRAMERPLLGYGYRAYWTPENKLRLKPTEDWSDGIGHAHNTYIDLMVELGLLGIVSFTLLLGILLYRIIHRMMTNNDFICIWAISSVIFILVRGMAEVTILQHADINWIYFIYFFALFGALSKENTKSEATLQERPITDAFIEQKTPQIRFHKVGSTFVI